MKKNTIFIAFTFVSIISVGQKFKQPSTDLSFEQNKNFFQQIFNEPTNVSTQVSPLKLNKTSSTSYKRIAGSSNIYGSLVTESRVLQYNKELNTVGLIYRASRTLTATIPNGNSGSLLYTWSSNNGVSWDSTVLAANATKLMRYPTGVFYNPSANTDPLNASIVIAGPWTNGTGWQGNYFGSKQLSTPYSTSSGTVTYVDNLTLLPNERKQDFARISPQITSDGVAHVLGGLYKDVAATTATAQAFRGAMINKGVFSAGTFTWTVDSLKPDFKTDANGNKLGISYYDQAWSENGQIGYVIFFGVDANALVGTSMNSYQPYVFKTTNAGTTWNRHAALFDFSSIQVVAKRLFAVQNNTLIAKPFFNPLGEGSSATVDANGNLHLFTSVLSSFWDDVASAPGNADSTEYFYKVNYNQVWNYLYDFKTTSTGWDAIYIDSLQCAATSINSNWSNTTPPAGPVDYDARLQISRTADGNTIFYSWADSDPALVSPPRVSILPDIFMKGYDLVSNKTTCTKNMSRAKLGVEFVSFFFYTSPIVANTNATTFQIPTIITRSLDNNKAEEEIELVYIDDNTFTTSEFTVAVNATCLSSTGVGINEIIGNVSKINFYPNPTSNNGTLEITLNDISKIDVLVLNSVGQVLLKKSLVGNSGNNIIDLNISDLNAGLYFYQVKTSNSGVITHKFVVQK
ncbi:MAG: T9SS type A sorting domain-containing protein [Bacteroidota bacterium]